MSDVEYRSPRQALARSGQIECHTTDMTATISADMPLEAAQAQLAKSDQWIPMDGDARLGVGRLVEENSTGPLRLGFGAWRDLLLGCQFRTSGGPLITAGGRTMKNVAGYDLVKLMVGQHGLFGAIETITVRTYKRPQASLVAEFAPSDAWLGEVIATPLRPRYAILSGESLVCGWLDDDRAIAHFEGLLVAHGPRKIQRGSLEEDIRQRSGLWHTGGDYYRAAVPPARILSFVKAAHLKNWAADAAFGIIIGPYHDDDRRMIRESAKSIGGSATFYSENQPPDWDPNPTERMVLERLKKAFVPVG